MANRHKHNFFYTNGLSLVLLALALASIIGQIATGFNEYNQFLNEHHQPKITIGAYLCSAHFIEATFENWESEFFQMALFVILTIFLRQKGSSESKDLDKPEDVDKPVIARANSPWAVKKGGIALAIYQHSLSIALILLFFISFGMHWYGSWKDYNLEQALKNKPGGSCLSYLANTKFWFESFQNWQSEFFSVFALIFLSIFLRQKGSPQSKMVAAPHSETGE